MKLSKNLLALLIVSAAAIQLVAKGILSESDDPSGLVDRSGSDMLASVSEFRPRLSVTLTLLVATVYFWIKRQRDRR